MESVILYSEQRAPRRNQTGAGRKRRAAYQQDTTDDITSTEMNAKSQEYKLDLDERDQNGDGKRVQIDVRLFSSFIFYASQMFYLSTKTKLVQNHTPFLQA